MKVAYLRTALADLDRILRWIAADDPARALSFVRELQTRAERLSYMPGRYPVVHRSDAENVHKMTHGSYLLYYRVTSSRVEVLTVRHGAQKAPRFD